MITLRRRDERGHFNFGWLDTYHTFSFGDYHDPRQVQFRSLRVINEDRVAPGGGFGTHPHRDMEIITYVLEGALRHRDSTGSSSVIRPGEVQRLSAGTGVTHSEHNASDETPVHLLQIWILPERKGLEPGYEQRAFPLLENRGKLLLVASRDGRNGAVTVHQDVAVYAGLLAKGDALTQELAPGRHAWLQVARGRVEANGKLLEVGDGARVSDERRVELAARDDCEVLVFDLA